MTPTPYKLLVSLALVFPALTHAAPPELDGTLRKIASSGTIALGYHESTPPFTFRTADGRVMGYSYDFALRVAEAVKRELNMPALQIVQVPFTTQNRFPTIQNGSADLSCGATTNTLERQKIVAFSNTIFVAGSRLMTRKDSGIKDFADLTGKNVVTFAASAEQNRRINIVSTFDRGETPFSVLQAGHADAYMMDDVLLYAAIHETWRPAEWVVTGTPQSFEAYGCILRKDDPAFKKVVDQEIARMMKSGEADAIYRKWLLSPIPPKGINFGFAMSEAMLELFKNPNDKPYY